MTRDFGMNFRLFCEAFFPLLGSLTAEPFLAETVLGTMGPWTDLSPDWMRNPLTPCQITTPELSILTP